MPEGLSASEVGKEIGEHSEHGAEPSGPGRALSITEAVLLSLVAILAAWSGFSAAKWGTESSLKLAKASATRTKANRAFQEALSLPHRRRGDVQRVVRCLHRREQERRSCRCEALPTAVRRRLPGLARHAPVHEPERAQGSEFMPQYHPTGAVESVALDNEADSLYSEGEHAAQTGDKYVRDTVILASVLFLVGISTHFPIRSVRVGLITVATVLLVFGVIQILQLPGPPA